jgi:hypothetical protein
MREDIQLRDIVRVSYTCAPGNLGSILFILGEFCIDLFCHLREGVRSVSSPEKVFGVQVKGAPRICAFRWDRHAVELELEAVRDESLVCPSVSEGRDKVNVSVHDEKN